MAAAALAVLAVGVAGASSASDSSVRPAPRRRSPSPRPARRRRSRPASRLGQLVVRDALVERLGLVGRVVGDPRARVVPVVGHGRDRVTPVQRTVQRGDQRGGELRHGAVERGGGRLGDLVLDAGDRAERARPLLAVGLAGRGLQGLGEPRRPCRAWRSRRASSPSSIASIARSRTRWTRWTRSLTRRTCRRRSAGPGRGRRMGGDGGDDSTGEPLAEWVGHAPTTRPASVR